MQTILTASSVYSAVHETYKLATIRAISRSAHHLAIKRYLLVPVPAYEAALYAYEQLLFNFPRGRNG